MGERTRTRMMVVPRAIAARMKPRAPAGPIRRVLVAHNLLLGDTLMLTALVAKLAGLGAFGAIALFVALFALIAYVSFPPAGGGIDSTLAAVTWISIGVVIVALAGLHIVLGRQLLELGGESDREA